MNYFHTLEIEELYDIDENILRSKMMQLQRVAHPDMPGGSLEKCSNINRAYHVLKDPVQRLEHILRLRNVDIASYSPDQRLLLQEMEYYNIKDDKVNEIIFQRQQEMAGLLDEVKDNIDDNDALLAICVKCKYIKRFLSHHGII